LHLGLQDIGHRSGTKLVTALGDPQPFLASFHGVLGYITKHLGAEEIVVVFLDLKNERGPGILEGIKI
jgi:hypothetical protein